MGADRSSTEPDGFALKRALFALLLFGVAFGVWDIAFYLFLKVLIDWPASFFTWDLLFLIPLPWTAPVIAPILVAISMIVTGVIVLVCESAGRPLRLTALDWGALFAGGFLVTAAFCWDYRNILDGGYPRPFHRPLFFIGEGIGLAGFIRSSRASIKSQ